MAPSQNITYGVNPVDTIITEKPVVKVVSAPVVLKSRTPEKEKSEIPTNQGNCFDYVPKYAQMYGVDPGLMTRIIKAESGGNPNAKNKNSTASGCAQFIRSTWEGTLRQMGEPYVSPFNAEINVKALAFKISRGGIRAWDASKNKWGK